MKIPSIRFAQTTVRLSISSAIALLFVPVGATAQISLDTLFADRRSIIAVAHLNFDCHKDTIIGRIDHSLQWRPYSIHWGRDPADTGTARGRVDSLDACFTRMPDSL